MDYSIYAPRNRRHRATAGVDFSEPAVTSDLAFRNPSPTHSVLSSAASLLFPPSVAGWKAIEGEQDGGRRRLFSPLAPGRYARQSPSMLKLPKPAPPPSWIEPCIPTFIDKPPTGANWRHEIKMGSLSGLYRDQSAGPGPAPSKLTFLKVDRDRDSAEQAVLCGRPYCPTKGPLIGKHYPRETGFPSPMETPMYKPTGPGEIDVFFEATGATIPEANLYNFDFDDFADRKVRPLKLKHARFLDEHVVPRLENNQGNIWLRGSASRIGSGDWNMTLSQVREGSVQAYLLDRGIKPDQIATDAVGNTLTASHVLDDAHDRSVLIWVYPRFDIHPTKQVPERPPTSRTFKIAVDAEYPKRWLAAQRNISVAGKVFEKVLKEFISISQVPFVVWDVTNNIACRYVYIGIGKGFDFSYFSELPKPHGPWSTFFTSKRIGVWQFARRARATIGPSIFLHVHVDNARGDEVWSGSVEIRSGITAVGVSGTIDLFGDFIRMEGPVIFRGP
jgi:outer membrane protein OmpA-like peptidoglycan-associated protein